ncbi:MAG: hypothetical protein M1833_002419 [Piccolia ochrophora]|nr:MAG: hypothetical protein M1833_002419 [Piccolia ochrophora]
MHWNRKYQEYTTKNRIYCPSRGCGEWIRPADIHTELGRKCGRCRRCKTKVCCQCNGKWHTRKECPKDEETNRFVEIAKKEGWQRCHNCSAMIELKEGCNHMTCRCTAEFCMICGSKWKTCNCPWFNYDAVEADRLQHMQIPVARRVPINHPHPHPPPPPPPPPANYADELAGRRRQEVRDEAIARRLQALNLDLDDDGLLHDTNNRRHHHHHHNHPPPHPQPPPGPPLRRHTTASRRYNADPSTRPAERVVPRRTASGTGYAAEADRHRPVVTVAGAGAAQMRAEVRQSRMAGLTREGRAMPGGRVGEWLRHVQPGLAAGEVGVVG